MNNKVAESGLSCLSIFHVLETRAPSNPIIAHDLSSIRHDAINWRKTGTIWYAELHLFATRRELGEGEKKCRFALLGHKMVPHPLICQI